MKQQALVELEYKFLFVCVCDHVCTWESDLDFFQMVGQ